MSLQALLGVELPVIQAPMAGVQGSAMTIAVSNAGGLGSLPGAMLTVDELRAELCVISANTSRPYNVNFFCHAMPTVSSQREAAWRALLAPYYREFGIDPAGHNESATRLPFNAEAANVLAEFKPPVISFHFGLPTPQVLALLRRWPCKIVSTATTIDEARWLESHGVDVVIAQGLEAGGHRGHFLSDDLSLQSNTFGLLPQMIAAVRIPVIAAGGIIDAKGVDAALAMGAVAAQAGTSYLLCDEATTRPVHRAALSAGEHLTALTTLFSGRPARGIFNRLMRELGPLNPAAPEFPHAGDALVLLRAAAELQGLGDFSPLWSGHDSSGCKSIPAARLTAELAGA